MGNILINDSENIILNGTFLQKKYSQILIKINKSNNNTRILNNQNDLCKTDEEISNIRDSSYLELFYVGVNVNFNNYTNPQETYMANLFWKLNSQKSFKSNLSFKTIDF